VSNGNRGIYLQIVEGKTNLGGRFVNVRRLGPVGGTGTFSLVFLADDTVTGKEIILKFFNPDKRSEAYRWECFEREARVLESLGGQKDIIGFVAARAEFTEQFPVPGGLTFNIPFAYYALEKAQTDVADKIANKTWTVNQILEAFRCMCRSVQRIHRLQYVHRDLKPDNFLVLHNGEVKLADFGTARSLDGVMPAILSNYDGPPGDIRYSAPEMHSGLHDVDMRIALRADIFSLGAILFEMLTGNNFGVVTYTPQLTSLFAQHMVIVSRTNRLLVYESIIESVINAHPLVSLESFAPNIPACVLDRLNDLYKCMCSFDYRKRNCDFNSIFRQIDTCLLILNNESKYRRWLDEKRKRRMNRMAKQQGGTK